MPVLVCALASLAVAWIRGASPLQLASVRLRWLALPLVAFTTQLLAFAQFSEASAPYALWVQLASGAALLAFLVRNLHYRAFALVIAGTALNLLVISANGGFMPIRVADMERAGLTEAAAQLAQAGRYEKSKPLDATTRLPWLADVIPLELPGRDRLMSIGDVLIAAGTFLLIQEALVRPRAAGAPRGSDPSAQPAPPRYDQYRV
jgi:hypothetical protein